MQCKFETIRRVFVEIQGLVGGRFRDTKKNVLILAEGKRSKALMYSLTILIRSDRIWLKTTSPVLLSRRP